MIMKTTNNNTDTLDYLIDTYGIDFAIDWLFDDYENRL